MPRSIAACILVEALARFVGCQPVLSLRGPDGASDQGRGDGFAFGVVSSGCASRHRRDGALTGQQAFVGACCCALVMICVPEGAGVAARWRVAGVCRPASPWFGKNCPGRLLKQSRNLAVLS